MEQVLTELLRQWLPLGGASVAFIATYFLLRHFA